MTPVSHGKPCAGNPHARFDEGASASEEPRRNALLHKRRETDRTKANCPRYTLSDKMISFVDEIAEVATHLEMRERSNK